MSCGYRKSQKPHEHRIFALLAPPCTEVHRAPRCIPAAWHRIAPCTTVRDRPCAPALRCISATLHHGARCSTMCDPATGVWRDGATPTKYASSDVQHAGDECEDYGGGEDVKFTGELRARRLRRDADGCRMKRWIVHRTTGECREPYTHMHIVVP